MVDDVVRAGALPVGGALAVGTGSFGAQALVRQADDTWRIAAFQNTKRQRVMERISFLFSPDTKPAAEK